jgi:hypothetical protein
MTDIVELDYKGFEIRQDETTGMVCLTDMWKSVGSPPNKLPRDWLEATSTAELLAEFLFQLNCGLWGQLKSQRPGSSRRDQRALERWIQKVKQASEEAGLIKASTGRYGGTYAIPKLAIAYAKVLSTPFHIHMLDILERISRGDVTYTAELIDRHSPGEQEWLEKRQLSKQSHRHLQDTILEHGSNGGHIFAWFPRINVFAITGLEPKDIKKRLKVKSAADGLTAEELAHLSSLQYLQSRGIKKYQCQGDEEIKAVMGDAAGKFASLLNDYSLPSEPERPTGLLGAVKGVMSRLLSRSKANAE